MALDLVIKNGTVVDGSGLPRYRADIGVTSGHIVEIDYQGKTLTLPPTADREIAPAVLARVTALRTGRQPDNRGWLIPI